MFYRYPIFWKIFDLAAIFQKNFEYFGFMKHFIQNAGLIPLAQIHDLLQLNKKLFRVLEF